MILISNISDYLRMRFNIRKLSSNKKIECRKKKSEPIIKEKRKRKPKSKSKEKEKQKDAIM